MELNNPPYDFYDHIFWKSTMSSSQLPTQNNNNSNTMSSRAASSDHASPSVTVSCQQPCAASQPTAPSVHDALVEALRAIDMKMRNSPYCFQVICEKEDIYEGIGSFAKLFCLANECEAIALLKAAKLCRQEGDRLCMVRKSWETLASKIPGCIYQQHNKQQYFSLGDIRVSFHKQKGQKKPAPKRQRWMKDILDRFYSNKNVKVTLEETTCTTENNNTYATNGDNSWFNERAELEKKRKAKADMFFNPSGKAYRRKLRNTDVGGYTTIMPNGHTHLHVHKAKKQKKAEEKMNVVREMGTKKKSDLDEINKLIIGTLAGKFPQVADVALEQICSIGGIIATSHLDLLRPNAPEVDALDFDGVVAMLPSRTTINTCTILTAAHRIIHHAQCMLKADRLYLGADKGSGVLVKVAFYYDPEKKCPVQVSLDFDKSGEDAKGGGTAIKHSLEKYQFADARGNIQSLVFHGGSSDSGGGFTKEAMTTALQEEGLAAPEGYIHVNCMSHNDQTNLRVGVEKTYGTGGLNMRNVPQLIHSFSDLQSTFDGKNEISTLLMSAWSHVRGEDTTPPKAFLYLMQEPILTRWGTVGQACQYTQKYMDVLRVFCTSICAINNSNSRPHLCAANFLSLSDEEEIIADLAFLASFDDTYFVDHLEFNNATDPNVGSSGFLTQHQLVRYFLKSTDLAAIKKDLGEGDILPQQSTQYREALSKRSVDQSRINSLEKARTFLVEFEESLHKHNEQFTSRDLLFLGCFGEHVPSRVVSNLLLGTDHENTVGSPYYSELHNRSIDLVAFRKFLEDKCSENIAVAAASSNFIFMKDVIKGVSTGIDIWGHALIAETYREQYLSHFGALPSTSSMVERMVKKAKQCQKTGKGERNVTAYGIAGDGLSDMCLLQSVVTTYPDRIKQLREAQQAKVLAEGKTGRPFKTYEEDLERGPSLTRNLVNHAYYLQAKANDLRSSIGCEMYQQRLKKTIGMLVSLDKQGSAARYSANLSTFEKSLGQPLKKKSARRLEAGVTTTALIRGEVPIFGCRKAANEKQFRKECEARGLIQPDESDVGFRDMQKMIKDHVVKQWIEANPGKDVPEKLGKHFKPVSNERFVY